MEEEQNPAIMDEGGMEVEPEAEGEENTSGHIASSDVAPALIAVHPLDLSVVVAVGSELRIFDLKQDKPIDLPEECRHSGAIRTITFGPLNSNLFASAGDDKLVKIWNSQTWRCSRTVCSEKRVSAVSISNDGRYVTFSDKFGVVWLVVFDGSYKEQGSVEKEAVPILGHYCSIITSMKFSPDGKFICTADRDSKIRITVFPNMPSKGAHEIQSFCLGHTDFVSCLAFTCPSDGPTLLLSGSGDSTVRLWDHTNGQLLHTCLLRGKGGIMELDDTEEICPAVTDICAIHHSSLVAVAVQRLYGVALLNCDFASKTLTFVKVMSFEKCVPTSLSSSLSAQCLWTVMGSSSISNLENNHWLARLQLITALWTSSDSSPSNPSVLEDDQVPGGHKLLVQLQGSLDIGQNEDQLVAAAASLTASMNNMLIKKQYSHEKRELRKRGRNDRKIKK